MTERSNPWAARYRAVASLAVIRKRSRIGAVRLIALDEDPIEVACDRVKEGLERVFVPTERVCEILLIMIEMALAHAEKAYPSEVEVSARSYDEDLPSKPYVPLCITGLDGGGKSALLKALERVLPADSWVTLSCSGDRLPLTASRTVVIKGIRSVRALYRAIAKGTDSPVSSSADMGNWCARWVYRRGCCLLGIDELQFLTQSERATVLVSQVLLASTYVGVPTVYLCNFSLCHRLLKLRPENKERLLTRHEVLVPEMPNSDDWLELLAEFNKVVSDVFDFLFVDKAMPLWNYTAGRKRDLIDLIVKSYRRGRRIKCKKITWEIVEETYHSADYFVSRQLVEALSSYALTGACASRDLVCPFEDDLQAAYLRRLKEVRYQRVADAANDSALTRGERKALAQIKREKSPVSIPTKVKKETIRRSKKATTAAALSQNAKLVFTDEGRRR